MNRTLSRSLLALLLAGPALSSAAFAHLIVAQQGTLNLHGDGAYLAVSVATSSLTGVDDDGDGLLSEEELSAPARIVEPTIAATTIGLALYDVWLARSGKEPPVSRLALVFGCFLIHGLGLGGALSELGVNPAQQVATLLGFNVGIELGQLSVAALALAGFASLQHTFGGRSVRTASSLMTFGAVVMGAIWLVERVTL